MASSPDAEEGRLPVIPSGLERRLRNLPIRQKLTFIVVVTSGVAVVLASAAFLAYDYQSYRYQMALDLQAYARNLASLVRPALDPENAGTEVGRLVGLEMKNLTLNVLQTRSTIEGAVIFDSDGDEFTRYERGLTRERALPSAPVPEDSHAFVGSSLVVYQGVYNDAGPSSPSAPSWSPSSSPPSSRRWSRAPSSTSPRSRRGSRRRRTTRCGR
jgi:hypothetical protein